MKVLKAGEYYVGDCCYVLTDDLKDFDWVIDFCEQHWENNENITVQGYQIVSYDTAYGDGVFPSNVGFEFPVDAGLIGVVPKELWKGVDEPFGCLLVNFEKDFVCDEFNGTLQFGHVVIKTDYHYTEEYEEDEE